MNFILNNFWAYVILCSAIFVGLLMIPKIFVFLILAFLFLMLAKLTWLLLRAVFLSYEETKHDDLFFTTKRKK